MAVSKTQDWPAPSVSSATPSGTLTIGGGTNRVLLFVQGIEINSTASCSVGIGGIGATGLGRTFWESGGAGDLQINYWYWNESALQSMSGNGVSYFEDSVLSKQAWSYATFSSCDQTTPVVAAFAVSASISNSVPLGVATVGNSSDYVAIAGVRDTANRTFGSWGSLTERHDVDGNAFRFGIGDGAWYANSVQVAGNESIQDVMVLASFVVKALSGNPTGSGDITAPTPAVDGDGSSGINALKPANRTMAGVGERSVVWQGSASLTAGQPTVSNVSLQFGGSGDLRVEEPVLGVGTGQRVVTASPSLLVTLSQVFGGANRLHTGSGAMSASIGAMTSDTGFGAFWYVSKEVYF